jgi:hypothetical protein
MCVRACVLVSVYVYARVACIRQRACVCAIGSVRESACILASVRVEALTVCADGGASHLRGRRHCSPAPQAGWTPLHNASNNGHLEVVEALLAKGADVEAKKQVNIARDCALCPSRSLARMQNAHGY